MVTDCYLMAATDLVSFNTVEHVGLRTLFNKYCPNIKLPSRSRSSVSKAGALILPCIIQKLKDIIQSHGPETFHITLDIWTDDTERKSYIGIHVHYITNYKKVSVLVDCAFFPAPHTAENIAIQICNDNSNNAWEFDVSLLQIA